MINFLKQKPQPSEIYDSDRKSHPVLEELYALFSYRELIIQFIARTIKTRYKRSILGVLWTMLNPLLTMIVLTIVFSNLFRFEIVNFPIYVLCGQVVWIFFSSATSGAMGEMVWSGDLLNRIYVPKSVFAVAAVGTGLVNFFLSIFPLLGIALVLGVRPNWSLLTWPVTILLLSIFCLGASLFLSTLAVYFADMLPVYEVILTIWLFATPIIYPVEIVPPQWLWLIKLNPLFYFVEAFRLPLLYGLTPGRGLWIPALIMAAVSITIGGLLFASKSSEYAYRL
jgi:ABC-2 type transport system permease protein